MTELMIPFPDDDDNKDEHDKSDELQMVLRANISLLQKLADDREKDHDKIDKVETTVGKVATTVEGILTDVDSLKNDQFVEPWQDANIQRAARIRVSSLLKLKWEKGGVVEECAHDYKAYFGKFLRCLHNDAKKMGLEGRKIHQTQRKNYQKLIEFIGEWVPVRGVDGQKEYYDMLSLS